MKLYQNMKIILTFLIVAYISITAASAATFTDLEQEINSASGTLILSDNYTYDSSVDIKLRNGITIDKNLIIDGNGKTIDAGNQTRIFNISRPNLEMTVKNITFKNGYTAEAGGAIYCISELTVTDCTFINNKAVVGGALFTPARHLGVENSVFENNYASDAGGSILTGGNVSITGSFFQNNTALDGSIHIMSTATDIENLLNYNVILESETAIYNNGTGTINADFNWWGDNTDPTLKVTGPIEINNYYTMRLASIDSPKYKEEYEFDYIFELNDNGDHESKLLPKFMADIKYNTELVGSVDGRYNETLDVTINAIKENEIEAYSFDTSITSLTFKVKGNVNLSIKFSEDNGTVDEPIEITIEAKDQDNNPMDNIKVKLYANDSYIDTITMKNGVGSYDYTPTDIGIVTIRANFEENEDYTAAKDEEELTVKGSVDLKIELSEDAVTVGEQIEITIEVTDQDGTPMDANVKLYANDIYLDTVSVINGFGSFDYTATDIGVVTITAEFEENMEYNATETEEDLIVNNPPAESSSNKKTTTKLNIVENVPPVPPVSEPPASEPPVSEPSVSEPPVSDLSVSESPVSELLKSVNSIQIGLTIIVLLSLVFAFGLYYRKNK